VRRGGVRQVSQGSAGLGIERCGRSVQARFVGVCGGAAGMARTGAVRCGEVRSGYAGKAALGVVRCGLVTQACRGLVRKDQAG